MALFDIIDDITEKQVLKTETGDNRIFGVVLGIVVNNYDKDMPGRVCVSVPTRDKDANELKWARVAMPYSGAKWGYYFLPEVGDQVLLAFEQGNIEKPYVIGCIPKNNDKFLKDSVHEKNQFKNIVTKNGNTISLEDNPEGDGQKDKITIKTSQGTHRLELDNDKKVMVLSDKDNKNQIRVKTEEGCMILQAEKKLVITVGDNIKLVMNSENGTVSLKAPKLKIDASDNINIKSSGSASIKGSNMNLDASGMMKIKSSAAVNIQGTPIKLG